LRGLTISGVGMTAGGTGYSRWGGRRVRERSAVVEIISLLTVHVEVLSGLMVLWRWIYKVGVWMGVWKGLVLILGVVVKGRMIRDRPDS
jgi:hypothetical protein